MCKHSHSTYCQSVVYYRINLISTYSVHICITSPGSSFGLWLGSGLRRLTAWLPIPLGPSPQKPSPSRGFQAKPGRDITLREAENHVQECKGACWTREGLLSTSLGACIHARTPIGKSQGSFMTYSARKGLNVCPLPSGPWTLWARMGGRDSEGNGNNYLLTFIWSLSKCHVSLFYFLSFLVCI